MLTGNMLDIYWAFIRDLKLKDISHKDSITNIIKKLDAVFERPKHICTFSL